MSEFLCFVAKLLGWRAQSKTCTPRTRSRGCVGRGKFEEDCRGREEDFIAGAQSGEALAGAWADATKPGGEGRDTEIIT